MSDEQPVIAPDQLKKGHPKAFNIAGVLTIIALILMMLGNHKGNIEDLYLGGTALLIFAIIVYDRVTRRNGLKR